MSVRTIWEANPDWTHESLLADFATCTCAAIGVEENPAGCNSSRLAGFWWSRIFSKASVESCLGMTGALSKITNWRLGLKEKEGLKERRLSRWRERGERPRWSSRERRETLGLKNKNTARSNSDTNQGSFLPFVRNTEEHFSQKKKKYSTQFIENLSSRLSLFSSSLLSIIVIWLFFFFFFWNANK